MGHRQAGRPSDEKPVRVHAGRRCGGAGVARRGRGMSPLEALACGTPVVATRVGGMAHASRHRAADTAGRCARHGRRVSVGGEQSRAARHRRCPAGHTSKTRGRGTGRSVDCAGWRSQWPTFVTRSAGALRAEADPLARQLVAWSHARRFETALALARAFRGKRILDYGSGDGTFLALAMMRPTPRRWPSARSCRSMRSPIAAAATAPSRA